MSQLEEGSADFIYLTEWISNGSLAQLSIKVKKEPIKLQCDQCNLSVISNLVQCVCFQENQVKTTLMPDFNNNDETSFITRHTR